MKQFILAVVIGLDAGCPACLLYVRANPNEPRSAFSARWKKDQPEWPARANRFVTLAWALGSGRRMSRAVPAKHLDAQPSTRGRTDEVSRVLVE
ncbi:MAG TPA: hypothetical protein DD670_06425 [Planctomycetaceae bacterium]|nr:hypothetical protein [Planctomycetaceae bacterium]